MKRKNQENKVIRLSERKSSHRESTRRGENRSSRTFPKIISITSGKGGVGKTNIVANLGFTLSRFGKKVLIFVAILY